MKSTLKKALIVTALMTLGLTLFNAIPTASAQLISPNDQPSLLASETGAQGDLRQLVLNIVNFALGFLGLIAVVFLIYAGFLYVTSAGNDENTGKAKKIILYSIIGILIILASFAIVNTVLDAASGVSARTTTVQ